MFVVREDQKTETYKILHLARPFVQFKCLCKAYNGCNSPVQEVVKTCFAKKCNKYVLFVSLARCHPRCHNKAICRRSNICQCRPGFHGHRCEHADVFSTRSSWFEAQLGATVPSTTTTPAVTSVSTITHRNVSVFDSDQALRDAKQDVWKTFSLRWQPLK